MGYRTGCHTTFHHRYHLVWAPKYRFKVLRGEVRLRVREIIRQVCAEMGVTIINGALSSDHVHMFVGCCQSSANPSPLGRAPFMS
jgi:putative transposase